MRRGIVFFAAASLALVACGSSSSKSSTATSTPPTTPVAPATPTTPAPSPTVPVAAQSTYLGGNAHPTYPAGTPGKVSVVYQAPISPQPNGTTTVPIVFRNDTKAGVSHVDISASATDATGKIVASGMSQGTDPSVVQPGQWAYAFIYFAPGTALAATNKLSNFSFNTSPADTSSYNTAPVQVTQANLSGTSIAGGVKNTTGHTVTAHFHQCLLPQPRR